jgi:hypothetical protein
MWHGARSNEPPPPPPFSVSPGCSFVVLAADCTAARSILVYKRDEDKVRER